MAGSRTRNRRGDGSRLREDLIEAARALLRQADHESQLSIRRITRAAGVSPQSFYLHFDACDELLFAAYEREWADLSDALQAAAAATAPGRQRLRCVASAYCDFAIAGPARYRALTGVQGTFKPDWDQERLPGSAAVAIVAQAVAEARATRRRRAASDADQNNDDVGEHTVMLIATLHGLVSLRVNKPTFPWPPLDRLVDLAVDHALAG
jgi:AcrR family transcriptional regulator